MAEVLLFHHVQGLTAGVYAFAGDLREAGHTVHVPDLFDGRTFDSIEEGMIHAKELGDAIDERADAIAAGPARDPGEFGILNVRGHRPETDPDPPRRPWRAAVRNVLSDLW